MNTPDKKTMITVSVRVSQDAKDKWALLADKENRKPGNWLETVIQERWREHEKEIKEKSQ